MVDDDARLGIASASITLAVISAIEALACREQVGLSQQFQIVTADGSSVTLPSVLV